MRERILNTIGFSLLGLCFALSLGRILTNSLRQPTPTTGGPTATIRIAHWQLESGVREAFDAIAAEYSRLHPGVRIVQIPIPERIYTNWLITQLVGGTAPDLIQVGFGITDERLARYFVPLGDLANSPNPYNAGTDLEHLPMRDTFFDGMLGGFNANLLEYYAVPLSAHSIRMYYNLDLLREITDSENLPATFDELMELCARARAYARARQIPFVPIAGSKYNSPQIMNTLFSSQTQRMVEDLNPPGYFGGEHPLRARQFLSGKWDLNHPSYRSGLALLREVGQEMQPGFMQLLRDDAMLLFVQGRSLMISSGSWDATSIRAQARFRIGVAPIPLPSTQHPRYGAHTLGSLTEAGDNASVGFGLTRLSNHPEIARDFLRFLASRRINQLWADTSGWIPSVLGVQPNESVTPFLPKTEGALGGIFPGIEAGHGLPEVGMLIENHFHLLIHPSGGPEAFLRAIAPGFRPALLQSLERRARGGAQASQRSDSQWAALAWLAVSGEGSDEDRRRWDLARQSLSGHDRFHQAIRWQLAREHQPAR